MYFESIGIPLSNPLISDQTTRTRETQLAMEVHQRCYDRPTRALERLKSTHKMTVPERLDAILDPGTPWFDLGIFVGDEETPLAGVYCVAGTICGLNVIVIANDNAQNAGAWVPGSTEKIQRAQDTARRLHIPVVWLIECPGLHLLTQEKTYGGSHGAGGIFEHQIRHTQAGLVQVAAVFGDCIAGGGYLPIFCDHVIMTEQATVCIGGTALNHFAKAGSGKLGGPDVHVHETGCADERVSDDKEACRRIRAYIGRLPSSAVSFYRIAAPLPPRFDASDLYAIVPSDTHKSFDVRELIARLVDGSLVCEIDPTSDDRIYACHALVQGLRVILIANQTCRMGSVLTRESILKMIRIVRDARAEGLPIIWLQDVSGFDIGETAEREGLLRHGAHLLRALTQTDDDAPHLTLCLRKASGAGYYAMKGRPFAPALIAGTVLTRLEVMAPHVLANTMYDAKMTRTAQRIETLEAEKQRLSAQAANYPQDVDNAASELSTVVENLEIEQKRFQTLEAQKASLLAHQESESDVCSAIRRGDLDACIRLCDLRAFVVYFVESAWQNLRMHQPR